MGSYNFPLQTIARSATLAVAAHRIVRDGASDGLVVQASAATQRLIGVTGGNGIAAGGCDSVEYAGIVPVEYGDDVAPGDPLTSDADGKAIPATAGQRIVGYACESGGLGTIGSVNVVPGYVEPTPGEMQVASLALTDDMLTDADGAQSFDFAAALPANACIVGYDVRVTEAFTDGAAGVFTLDVGLSGGDLDQLIDGLALGSIANLGNAPGVRPTGKYGAVTLAATVLGSVNVDTATAGAAVVDVFYFVPPS